MLFAGNLLYAFSSFFFPSTKNIFVPTLSLPFTISHILACQSFPPQQGQWCRDILDLHTTITGITTKMKEAKTKIKTSKLWFSTLMKSIKKWQITNLYPSMTIKTNKRGMLWARGCHLDKWSFIIVSYFSCDDANCDDCDKQVNTYCGSLVAGLGGSGDRERKWERERDSLLWPRKNFTHKG